jgi:hypothetical protein
MIDPFERIREFSAEASNRAKRVFESVMQKKDSDKIRKENHIANLQEKAEESCALMGDEKYKSHKEFLTEMRAGFSKALETVDPKSLAEIAGIQYSIRMFDAILNYPKKAVKEYEAITKDTK